MINKNTVVHAYKRETNKILLVFYETEIEGPGASIDSREGN